MSPSTDRALTTLPTYDDVESASRQIAGVAHRTPVATSRSLNAEADAALFFKCENLQRAGAFKFRGAYNALSRLLPEQRRRGVVTFSSGNHAQAIALAGQLLDIPRVVVMPSDAPEVKRAATAAYGGEIVLYDRDREDREAIGRALASERGLTLIPPYDHPHIIAGQGTAALELLDEVGPLDMIVSPCGGGGLLSGTALAASTKAPGCQVIGVEPDAGDDATRSFRTKVLQRVDNPKTIADGARTPSLGTLTFPLVLKYVAGMTTVDDATLLKTMLHLWQRLKLVVEPTGALAAAAVLHGRSRPAGQDGRGRPFERADDNQKTTNLVIKGKRIGIVLSGGNVDLSQVCQLIAAR